MHVHLTDFLRKLWKKGSFSFLECHNHHARIKSMKIHFLILYHPVGLGSSPEEVGIKGLFPPSKPRTLFAGNFSGNLRLLGVFKKLVPQDALKGDI